MTLPLIRHNIFKIQCKVDKDLKLIKPRGMAGNNQTPCINFEIKK